MTSVRTRVDAREVEEPDHRRFLVIAVVVLLIVSMPALLWWRASRSTAAFADAEVLETNRLGAATLDLEIGTDTIVFTAENLAPGDAVSGQLELVNAGTLPMVFTVLGTSDGDPLADWLRFDIWRTDSICRPDEPGDLVVADIALTPRAAILVGEVGDIEAGDEAKLAVGQSTLVCVGARLLLDAPNEVQGRRTDVDLIVNAVHDLEAEQ